MVKQHGDQGKARMHSFPFLDAASKDLIPIRTAIARESYGNNVQQIVEHDIVSRQNIITTVDINTYQQLIPSKFCIILHLMDFFNGKLDLDMQMHFEDL